MRSPAARILIRPARLAESAELTDVCIRSKAIWGYDATFMNACRDELTITNQTFARSRVQVAEQAGRIIGVAELKVDGETAFLEKLFVDPALLRCGAGRMLFHWARAEATATGAVVLVIESDPGASAFYRSMGAIDDGVVESLSIPHRRIPKLKLPLRDVDDH